MNSFHVASDASSGAVPMLWLIGGPEEFVQLCIIHVRAESILDRR